MKDLLGIIFCVALFSSCAFMAYHMTNKAEAKEESIKRADVRWQGDFEKYRIYEYKDCVIVLSLYSSKSPAISCK